MKILGYDLSIKKAEPEISSSAQIRDNNPQGPMTSVFGDFVYRKVSADFYEKLREGIPVIDAAISRLISLNGTIKIIGDNMDLVKELEDFCLHVPVGDMQEGIHAWHQNAWNETFEQGFSMTEFLTTPDMKDIAGLRVADSKDIIFRKNSEGKAEPWYRYPNAQQKTTYYDPSTLIEQILTATYGQTISLNGVDEVKLNPANKLYLSINNENSDPYGVSLMRSMEFCSQILCTIQNSIKNVAERFGDPMYHAHLKTKSNNDIETRRKKLEDDFKIIVDSKRKGWSGDLVTATGIDGDVVVKVIGAEGKIMTFEIPLRHVLEQLLSKANLPAWMVGIYWSSTERMATLEVESVLQDAKVRHFIMLPKILYLLSTFLTLRGRKWKSIKTSLETPGDWGVIFEIPNLRDLVAQAQARFLNGQADMMMGAAAGSASNTQTTVNVGSAFAEIRGMKIPLITPSAKGCCSEKELSRPVHWPELDKIEDEYESELKFDWEELRQRIFSICKLNIDKDYKDDAPFTFTDDQRQAAIQALEDHIGIYDITDPDSPIRWYYGQSYSLGLIQAARMAGKERPILDIIKNKEIYDELCTNGFQLLKDKATKTIVSKIIPEMQAQMLAGENPRHVADRLKKLFGNANSDWDRLARSEMSMAAESAKLNEWTEYGIDTSDTPLPVKNTHPRCRCTTTIKKIDGKSVAVLLPAPDACALCFSLAG